MGRNAILRDPNFHGGRYYELGTSPAVGLAIARMIGHITYLSPQAMHEKFEANRFQPRAVPTEFEKKFSVGSYLGYQGDKFVERFDANSYITLSMAMDLFDLTGRVAVVTGASRGLGKEMAVALARAGAAVVIGSRHEKDIQAAAEDIRRLLGCRGRGVCDHARWASGKRGRKRRGHGTRSTPLP